MKLRKNVVEYLWVVNLKKGGSRYQIRVQAESEETAKAKAKRDVALRFNSADGFEITGADRIDPEDFV